MKKILTICLCLFTVLSMSSCRKNNTGLDSVISSDGYLDEPLVGTETQSKTSTTHTESTKVSSKKRMTSKVKDESITTEKSHVEESSNTTKSSNTTQVSTTTKKASSEGNSYEDIVCAEILNFQQVSFSTQSNDTIIFITIPQEWKLKKSENGYSIVKNSQTIGSITTSMIKNDANESVNVFHSENATGGMKITYDIDRVGSDNEPSYTRTLCYNYDEYGKSKSIVLTFPYEEVDSSAVYKMRSTAKKLAFPEKNMGILQIQDNRNEILILGNSFVATSNIGEILQTMCGSAMSIEAQSRGYATVGTYTKDEYMMQNIRAGRYSVVLMCGLYSASDVYELEKIIDACEYSNTKLAIFPAHNENRFQIESAASAYPNTILIDWKAEIDTFISSGVDRSYFCIADSHNHSTPLAGYVGAHMVYRAVFNKIPQNTYFAQVSKSQIDLLGEYATTGSMDSPDKSATYILE